jgi:hypothetical protein
LPSDYDCQDSSTFTHVCEGNDCPVTVEAAFHCTLQLGYQTVVTTSAGASIVASFEPATHIEGPTAPQIPILGYTAPQIVDKEGRLREFAVDPRGAITIRDHAVFNAFDDARNDTPRAVVAAGSPAGVHFVRRPLDAQLRYISPGGIVQSIAPFRPSSFLADVALTTTGDSPRVAYHDYSFSDAGVVFAAPQADGTWSQQTIGVAPILLLAAAVDHRVHAVVGIDDRGNLDDVIDGQGGNLIKGRPGFYPYAWTIPAGTRKPAAGGFIDPPGVIEEFSVVVAISDGEGYRTVTLPLGILPTPPCPCPATACPVVAPMPKQFHFASAAGRTWLIFSYLVIDRIDDQPQLAPPPSQLWPPSGCGINTLVDRSHQHLAIAELAPDLSAIQMRWQIISPVEPLAVAAAGTDLHIIYDDPKFGGIDYAAIDTSLLPPPLPP